MPTAGVVKLAEGVPVTEKVSPFCNPTYAAVPLSVVDVKPLYVLLLAENDLLEHGVDNRMYKTTEKGKKFINTYNKMQDYVKMLEG